MEIEYTDFIIYVLIFVVSCIFSIIFWKQSQITSFKSMHQDLIKRLNFIKKRSQEILNAQIEAINNKSIIQSEIIDNFKHIHDEIQTINARISSLNKMCETREELENEILKLKNILKRKEKRL